jgi:hypothetical protein
MPAKHFCGKIYLKNLSFVYEMSAFQTVFARHNVFKMTYESVENGNRQKCRKLKIADYTKL